MQTLSTLRTFTISPSRSGRMHALAAVSEAGLGAVSRLPICLRVILESILRNCDGRKVTVEHIRQLASWEPQGQRNVEIPVVVARILLQDFTGVPLLCDLAAMRSAAIRQGRDAELIEPRVRMDLVIDHSVQIDHFGSPAALERNIALEFARNAERYRFIRWGMQAFDSLRVVPPGIGIVHQVNLEYLSPPLWEREGVYYPDSLVGTDSHTTMINGLGVVGWGVGGIEAEAAMLGQPVSILMPDVIGVELVGDLRAGTTTTDLVLHVTEQLRKADVVGKFVEFFGAGAAALAVPDRATLANMAPEYGATMGFFPVDARTLEYLRATGRDEADILTLEAYLTAQGMFGMPRTGDISYTTVVEIDLAAIEPSIAGPRRPQDRIALEAVKDRFTHLLSAPVAENGYGKPSEELSRRYALTQESFVPGPVATAPTGVSDDPASVSEQAGTLLRNEVEMVEAAPQPPADPDTLTDALTPVVAVGHDIGHGDVIIAAITSCTNTSNPGVMLAAGLLARKAVERGLGVRPGVKTSLAPGSRVVTSYLSTTGLLPFLERLGFAVVAYGCTTCIGNSGPLDPRVEAAITRHDLVCAAVLSGNRNFEARIHPNIRANFLMSPPLVVAFAIAGRVGIDFSTEPLGTGADGRPVYLHEVWPTAAEIAALMPAAQDPAVYRQRYSEVTHGNSRWDAIVTPSGAAYAWAPSTYIAEPPFFAGFTLQAAPLHPIHGARALALFGDSITTDHISPAGAITVDSPAGRYLRNQDVAVADFNSYGARRGNHDVMMRGTFANVRIRNLMLPKGEDGTRREGGWAVHQPSGEVQPIYDVAMRYQAEAVPAIVFAGSEYGTGSSRDWAAKGPRLLGVRAVVARSFERIHRSNLIGMGVLPLQFLDGESINSVPIRGDEYFDVEGLQNLRPHQEVDLIIRRGDGSSATLRLLVRLDTPIEVDYYLADGILPYALRELLRS